MVIEDDLSWLLCVVDALLVLRRSILLLAGAILLGVAVVRVPVHHPARSHHHAAPTAHPGLTPRRPPASSELGRPWARKVCCRVAVSTGPMQAGGLPARWWLTLRGPSS